MKFDVCEFKKGGDVASADTKEATDKKVKKPSACGYEGGFQDGKRHGHGVFTWPEGNVYTGEWEDDEQHGKGSYFCACCGTTDEGEWKRGERVDEPKKCPKTGKQFVEEARKDYTRYYKELEEKKAAAAAPPPPRRVTRKAAVPPAKLFAAAAAAKAKVDANPEPPAKCLVLPGHSSSQSSDSDQISEAQDSDDGMSDEQYSKTASTYSRGARSSVGQDDEAVGSYSAAHEWASHGTCLCSLAVSGGCSSSPFPSRGPVSGPLSLVLPYWAPRRGETPIFSQGSHGGQHLDVGVDF